MKIKRKGTEIPNTVILSGVMSITQTVARTKIRNVGRDMQDEMKKAELTVWWGKGS